MAQTYRVSIQTHTNIPIIEDFDTQGEAIDHALRYAREHIPTSAEIQTLLIDSLEILLYIYYHSYHRNTYIKVTQETI